MPHLEQLENADHTPLYSRMDEADRYRQDAKCDSAVALCLMTMSLGVVVAFLWAWRQIVQMWSGM